MKKFLKSTVVLAFLSVTMTSMASNPKMSLTSNNDSKSVVFQMDAQSMESKIKVIDENAQTIYSTSILNEKYAKTFNLKDLAVGTYYFTINNALTSVVYTLNVKSKEITIANKKENASKPVFRKKGDKVSINFYNANQQKVDIEIINSRGNIFFKESSKGELVIGKAFNFSKSIKDTYTIMVNDGEDTYYQNIVIK